MLGSVLPSHYLPFQLTDVADKKNVLKLLRFKQYDLYIDYTTGLDYLMGAAYGEKAHSKNIHP